MFYHQLQYFEIFFKCIKSAHFNEMLSTVFLKVLNIYLFTKIFQKVNIVILQ